MIERLRKLIASMPIAHRAVVGACVVVGLVAVLGFTRWVSAPSWTVLYGGLDGQATANVITELEAMGRPYQLGQNGSILVPRATMLDTKARLAGVGIATSVAPEGYSRLDNQGLTVSDFRQRVDYKIAIEGELSRTLMAMDAIDNATVHLAIPEDDLFRETSAGATASVLIDSSRMLGAEEIETVTFLVSSSVEGLSPRDVTVADTEGRVLSAPGSAGSSGTVTDRNLRMTREYEASIAGDITRLLDSAIGLGRASVVVKATLDFDERQIESETFAPESQVAIRENIKEEDYTGVGGIVGGIVGVDGGPIAGGDTDGETSYTRGEQTTVYGVDRVLTKSTSAPGDVEKLSVAIVMDDGTLSGIVPPDATEIQSLVAAAVGLDAARGDTIRVTAVALPELEAVVEIGPSALGGIIDMIPQVIGMILLVLIAIALFLATRRKGDPEDPLALLLPALVPDKEQKELAAVGARAIGSGEPTSIADLVAQQPDEIASLLRSWLAEGDDA